MSLESELAQMIRTIVREEVQSVIDLSDLRLLSAEQVAEMLGYPNARGVYQLKRTGKLAALNLGDRTLRFRLGTVREYIKSLSDDKAA
jgi:hypothetical protein